MMKYGITGMMAVLALAVTAATHDVKWLGTGTDAKWTTAANWEGGVVPGLYGSSLAGDLSARAVFGTVTAGAHTTVDLTNVKVVSNILFAAGAPAFTLGTSVNQPLRIFTRGGITLESGVSTTQTVSYLYPDYTNTATGVSATENTGKSYFTNNGAAPLVVNRFDNSYNSTIYLAGTGGFVLTNIAVSNGAYLENQGTGTVTIGGPNGDTAWFKSIRTAVTGWSGKWIIPQGLYLSVRDSGSDLQIVRTTSDVIFSGDGVYGFRNGTANKSYYVTVPSGKTFVFDVDLMAYNSTSKAFLTSPFTIYTSGSGTVEFRRSFRNPELAKGLYKLANEGATLRLGRMGHKELLENETSNFGGFEPLFAKSATIEWTGTGDETDRTIGFIAAVTATLKNSGTGTLTYTGTITQSVDNCTLKLNAATAPIVFRGTNGSQKKLYLANTGASTVTVDDLGTFAAAEVGGTLKINAATGTFTGFNFSTVSSAARVELPENCALTVKGVSIGNSSAKIDFVVPATSSLTISGHAAGDIDTWLTINGAPCRSDANGLLHAYRADWESAASGSWAEATNWRDHVPVAKDRVFIAATGADYTVSAGGPLPAMPYSLTLGTGEADYTATLKVDQPCGITNCYFSITNGGALLVDAAPFTIYGFAYFQQLFTGGSITLTNGARLAICDGFRVGTGSLRVTDTCGLVPNQGLTYSRTISVKPNEAGDTARLEFTGNALSNYVGDGACYIGGTAGSRAVVDIAGQGTTSFLLTYNNSTGKSSTDGRFFQCNVGDVDGYGELNLKSGLLTTGNWGLRVGVTAHGAEPQNSVCGPTGVVNMTGGKIAYSGWNNASVAAYCGLIVGDGSLVKAPGNSTHCVGRFNFAGGTLVSNQGYFMLGVGQGEGTFVQTGGAIDHQNNGWNSAKYVKPDGTSNFVHDVYLGLAGGVGRYYLTNGSFYAINRVFVGGAPTNDLCRSTAAFLPDAYHDGTRQDGYGLLSLQGGTFRTTKDCYVGAFGRGRIEIGTNGYLHVNNLVLSNATESVLAMELGNDGFGTNLLDGALVFTSGAKLVIDARNLTKEKAGYIRLVSATSVTGEPAEVEILPPTADNPSLRRRVEQGEVFTSANGVAGLYFRLAPRGTAVFLR